MTAKKCSGLTAAGKPCKNLVSAGATCGQCKGGALGASTGASPEDLKAQALLAEAFDGVDLAAVDAEFVAADTQPDAEPAPNVASGEPFKRSTVDAVAKAYELLVPSGYFVHPSTGEALTASQLEPVLVQGAAAFLHRNPPVAGAPSTGVLFLVPAGAFNETDDGALLARYAGRNAESILAQIPGKKVVGPSDAEEVHARAELLASKAYFTAGGKTFQGDDLKLVDVDGVLHAESSNGLIRWRLPAGVFTSQDQEALTERYAGRFGEPLDATTHEPLSDEGENIAAHYDTATMFEGFAALLESESPGE